MPCPVERAGLGILEPALHNAAGRQSKEQDRGEKTNDPPAWM
jgi:hypothetical protein